MVEITLLDGLVGAIGATIVMTVLMLTLGDDSPPPTALFWSQYIGDDEADAYLPQGMALHMVYGIGAGVALAAVLVAAGVDDVATTTALGAGVAYGIVLFLVAAVFWMNVVLDLDPEPKDVGLFVFFHLVYGTVLGGVLAVGLV